MSLVSALALNAQIRSSTSSNEFSIYRLSATSLCKTTVLLLRRIWLSFYPPSFVIREHGFKESVVYELHSRLETCTLRPWLLQTGFTGNKRYVPEGGTYTGISPIWTATNRTEKYKCLRIPWAQVSTTVVFFTIINRFTFLLSSTLCFRSVFRQRTAAFVLQTFAVG